MTTQPGTTGEPDDEPADEQGLHQPDQLPEQEYPPDKQPDGQPRERHDDAVGQPDPRQPVEPQPVDPILGRPDQPPR